MSSKGHDLCEVAGHFQFHGKFLSAQPYGSGHINETYCASISQGNRQARYILQRINHNIFKNPVALMENVQRVTAHLNGKLKGEHDSHRRVLTLIPTHDGAAFWHDAQGNYWRAYDFIENARTYDAVETPQQAFEAAKAFGQFQKMLADFPAPRLHDTIPDFHHTPKRFAALEKTIETDACNRATIARPEIEFALKHEPIVDVILDAMAKRKIPERITHNDTKFNNVMMDVLTGEAMCIVDLDTVMPGCALYDFGDMVRTTTSPTLED